MTRNEAKTRYLTAYETFSTYSIFVVSLSDFNAGLVGMVNDVTEPAEWVKCAERVARLAVETSF